MAAYVIEEIEVAEIAGYEEYPWASKACAERFY